MRRNNGCIWVGRATAAVVVCVAAGMWSFAALAASDGAVAPSQDMRSWLLRIQSAASQGNYQGTLVVTTNHGMSSSRVAHYCDGKQLWERVDSLDGQARHVYRHNETVLTVWPRAKVARTEQRDAVALFPELISGSESQLLKSYEMQAQGTDRVADHDTVVFLLQPRDDRRFAQRLWAERESGLLLRADVLAPDGRILETAAFTDVAIGVRAQPIAVIAPMQKLDGYRVLRSVPQRTSLESEGWRLAVPVIGFTQISCVKRQFETADDDDRDSAVEVLQTIFSDGLTHVSVFIEPLRAERRRPGGGVFGATHTLTLQLGAHWVTVVGDVPMATLKQFAAALERMR